MGHISCQKTYSCMCPSLQVAASARRLLQHVVSMGCSFLQGTPTCSVVVSCMDCRVEIYSDMVHHGLPSRDTASLWSYPCTVGESLQGGPSPPPSSLTLMSARMFLSHFLTGAAQVFLHIHKYVTQGCHQH